MRLILASLILVAWQLGPIYPPKAPLPVDSAAAVDMAGLHAQAKEAMLRLQHAQNGPLTVAVR